MLVFAVMLSAVFFSACQQLEKPSPEAFYSETEPPRAQVFRWSNGKMPSSFDPVRAAAPPDTDIARAVFDGLTEIDPKSLEAVPALALKWESADDGREWTFELRKDASWSNGDPLTAEDFVRSWKRVGELGDEIPHSSIVSNIKGMRSVSEDKKDGTGQTPKKTEKDALEAFAKAKRMLDDRSRKRPPADILSPPPRPAENPDPREPEFGAVAVEDHILKVTLSEPDAFFPRLAAHPVLRPVHQDEAGLGKETLSSDIVTSGAFRISAVDDDGVTLDRWEDYYGRGSVALESVRVSVAKDADAALADYRAGRVDAVTNTEIEPLALKLLTPYVDFRRSAHSALNFYEFNREKAPFNDRRVREALAIAIDRKRLTEDLMDGATRPAYGFLPFGAGNDTENLKEDIGRARELMQKAGFEGGRDFPKIRLVINRNDLQQKVAGAVAEMWKEALGVETEIEIREYEELEKVREEGEFDLIRRGAVLPTSDETANMLAIFGLFNEDAADGKLSERSGTEPAQDPKLPSGEKGAGPQKPEATPDPILGLTEFDGLPPAVRDELTVEIGGSELEPILTAEQAVLAVPAIPLYFPTSYSLVKPYVLGFDINPLDAPLLKAVRIDSRWSSASTAGR